MQYKVLHIITRLANGGAEETVFDLLIQLANRGIYCDLAVGKESSPEVLEKFNLPKECSIYTISHMVRNPKITFEFAALKEIRNLIKKNQYNIVHTHGSKAGILGRIAAHKEKVPAIIGMIHGISFPPAMGLCMRILYKNIERYTARFSDALVCVGEDMKQKYISARIGKKSQYSVIYTGMNLKNFSKVKIMSDEQRISAREKFSLPKDLDTVIIGSVGRLEDRKNQKELIAMIPSIIARNPKVHLCLIGDGPNQETLKMFSRELGVSDKVSFTGYLAKVWDVLPALDIHCMVSLWEGLPRVLVQTSAAGIPNVCYKVDGAWEIIDDKKSGYIVAHGDKNNFVSRILELIADKKKRKDFGKIASNLADERWSLEKFGADVASLYEGLLKDL